MKMKKLLLIMILGTIVLVSCKKEECGYCEEIHESYYWSEYYGIWDKEYDSKQVYLCEEQYENYYDVEVTTPYPDERHIRYQEVHQIKCN